MMKLVLSLAIEKNYITHMAFGSSEREYVNSILLRLLTRKFASVYVSWAGVKK